MLANIMKWASIMMAARRPTSVSEARCAVTSRAANRSKRIPSVVTNRPDIKFSRWRRRGGALMLHGILVDGMIQRIDGRPQYADAEIKKRREAGHTSAYLFAARNEQEFERKKQAEIAKTFVVSLAMIMRDEFVNPFAQRALAEVDHALQASAVSPTLAQHRQAYSGTQP